MKTYKTISALQDKEKERMAEIEKHLENGVTFAENASIKAKDIADKVSDAIVMADDSGLVVDALNGEPGIYSARYLGEDTPYSIKNANIIERLEGIPVEGRSARFVCAIAAVLPDGRVLSTEGTIEGYIGYEERGNGGFGYDPLFQVTGRNCTAAQLPPQIKNLISHRARAIQALTYKLKYNLHD